VIIEVVVVEAIVVIGAEWVCVSTYVVPFAVSVQRLV